jgi:hypothetical protein
MISCDGDKQVNNGGWWYNDEWFATKIFKFQECTVSLDTIPPQIKPLQFPMNGSKRIRIQARDNWSSRGIANEISYRATLDDQWIKMGFDLKSDLLYYDFLVKPKSGDFKLEVWDHSGNRNSWSAKIK